MYEEHQGYNHMFRTKALHELLILTYFIPVHAQHAQHVVTVIKPWLIFVLRPRVCITSDTANEWTVRGQCSIMRSGWIRQSQYCMHVGYMSKAEIYMDIWANMLTCKTCFHLYHSNPLLNMYDILYKARGQETYLLKFYHLKGWDFKSSCRYGVQDLPSQACGHIKAVAFHTFTQIGATINS